MNIKKIIIKATIDTLVVIFGIVVIECFIFFITKEFFITKNWITAILYFSLALFLGNLFRAFRKNKAEKSE